MSRKIILGRLFALVLLLNSAALSRATSTLPMSLDEHAQSARVICRGTILDLSCFKSAKDGQIYTRALVRVDETFKGTLPRLLQIMHRGGCCEDRGETDGFNPQLQVGEERLLFLARRKDGTLYAAHGGPSALRLQRLPSNGLRSRRSAVSSFIARHHGLLEELRRKAVAVAAAGDDARDQAGTIAHASEPGTVATPLNPPGLSGLFVDGAGISSRFIAPDRGEPIRYLVDADYLPAGITLEQALEAIASAAAAWTAVTGVQFQFDGLESFGMAAANVPSDDGRIRIQMHDSYGYILSSSSLAIGGRVYTSSLLSPAGWGTGGNVAGNEFHRSLRGYITVKHTKVHVRNPATLAEVLCHELGHVLSLAHSSEDLNEPDPVRKGSIMYYLTHADGRGATLGSYDPPVIRQAHPPLNTPPFTFDRIMDIVTDTPVLPAITGVNEIELRGYDLQTPNPTLTTTNATSMNGYFLLTGNKLKFIPAGFFGGARLDPAGNSFYDRIAIRFSDGTHASPYAVVRVLSFNPDSYPSPTGDGIPDTWMTSYFGSPNPAAGANRGANQDFDGDGLSNFLEYQLRTDPTDGASRLRIASFGLNSLQWEAKPYELYEIYTSTNLSNWVLRLSPVVPTTAMGNATSFRQEGAALEFFRIEKVP